MKPFVAIAAVVAVLAVLAFVHWPLAVEVALWVSMWAAGLTAGLHRVRERAEACASTAYELGFQQGRGRFPSSHPLEEDREEAITRTMGLRFWRPGLAGWADRWRAARFERGCRRSEKRSVRDGAPRG